MRYFHGHRALRLAVVLASIALAPAALAQSCNEQCLKGFLHRYLAQLPKHDPAPLPLAAHVEALENTVPVGLGEGSWKNVTDVLPGLEFADPVTHDVIYAGGVHRGDALGMLFLRLKVLDGRITESEMITTGAGAVTSPAPDLSGLMYPDILYDAIVPPGRRLDRAHLMQIPLLYAEGLAKGDGSIPPFGPRCDRWAAGGRKLTNNPTSRGGAVTCAMAVDGMKRMSNRAVLNRRVVVVDVPRGIAVGMFVVAFSAGGRQVAQNTGEIFKVVDGRIRTIEEFGAPGRMTPASTDPRQ